MQQRKICKEISGWGPFISCMDRQKREWGEWCAVCSACLWRCDQCFSDLERFIHYTDENVFIKAAILHYQFQMTHPLIDANGRIGRLLVLLFLYGNKILHSPVYSSQRQFRHILRNTTLWYKREHNRWYRRLDAFLFACVRKCNETNAEKLSKNDKLKKLTSWHD